MKFTKYIELISEQTEEIPQFQTKKRKGEYLVAGDKNKAIIKAIEEKKMISFMYSGPRKRTKDFDGKMMDSVKPGKRQRVFPVAIGLSKKNKMIVRCWIEPPNPSKKGFTKKSVKDIPNWRTFMVSRMSDLRVLEDNFDLSKLRGYNPSGDKSMRVVYKSAKLGDIAKPKTVTKPKAKPEVKPAAKPKTTVKPAATPKPEPEKKPTAKPLEKPKPTAKPEAKPEIKPKEKPPVKPEPEKKPEVTPAKTKELPQVKTKEKPTKTPEGDKEEMEPLVGLSEQIQKIKTLMYR